MGSENDEAGLSEKHVEPVKSVPGEALINACATVEVSPEPSVEAAQPLTASTQKESFELVGRATAGLLAAAYCSQDPKVIHKLAEALNLTGDPLLVGSEFADSPAEGRKNDITDSSTSTPQPEAEEESFVSSHDQELACNSSFCLQRVPLGSVLFSGSLTISQQGSLSVLGPATLCFENGTKYTGLLCSRMRLCGEASIEWPTGATYKGQVTAGLRHGVGTFTSADGKFTYEGEWYQGVRSGWGVLSSADGSRYSGEWVAGRRHGFGEQVFADGSRYEGQWVDGLQEGQGLMVWKEPSVQYVGEWRQGTVSGWGRQTWIEAPDFDGGGAWTVGRNLQQNQYEGQFRNGRREGVGAFSYSNGARYEGSWIADQKHGIGTFKSETGALYEGLFVYDRMAEAPPNILDDPVRALVDLSTAQQAEVYRHLEEYNGQSLWNQAPACERLAARTIRSVYRTMLRNVCVLRRVYGAYRRFAPMPHSDPYVLSCAQFWCLAFDADLLSPSSSLYDTAKLLLSSGSDKNFQRARRLSGGTPATLTVIEKERRRSSQSIDFRLTDLAAGAQGSPRTAIPTPAPQPATLWEAQDEAQATTAYAASTLKADQQQDPENHFPEGAAAPGMAMSTPETPKQTLGRSHKARSSAYAAIAEDSLRLHRRPVLFTAFLRALVLLLQIRLRSLRRENRNNSARGSEASSPGAVFEGLDLDDPNCLSLAWIALCRKLRIFSDTLERQIQNEFRGASHNNKDPQKEYENQATGKSTQQADSGGSGSSSFSRQSSEQSHLKEGVPPQPPLRREGSLSQQLKGSPSGQGRMKPSINRQPSGTASTSTRKTPDAARWVTATGGAADDSRPQDISQSQGGSREESFVLAGEVDEIAACAGRHVEVFRQAAFAEKSCILDDALHKALFSSSRQQPDSSGIQGAMVCSVRVLFRLLDIAGLVLSSDNQQVDRGAADARGGFPAGSPRSSTGSGTAPRSRRSSLGGSILLPRLSASRGRLSRSRPSKAVEWPTNAGEATSILRATPLRTFALPTLLLVAVMLEVLPASVDLKQNHQHNNHQLKNPFRQQGRAHDQPKLQEVDFVEFATCSLGDTAAARREEIQRQQQQQMMILDQQQHTLREAIRKGLLSWSEIANWNLTFIEVQRLFLRIVQLKMPPAIAALLTLEKQVEEFLRLLSTAALPSLGSTQPLPNASLLQADTQEQAQICQQPYLSGNDSPAARSDATFSAALTGDGERSRCFWHGFCGTTIKGRPIYDMPLKIDDSVSLEVQDSEDAAGSDTSDSSN